jgi:hypothetical protein
MVVFLDPVCGLEGGRVVNFLADAMLPPSKGCFDEYAGVYNEALREFLRDMWLFTLFVLNKMYQF